MDLHPDDPAFDPETQQRHDRRRLFRALNLSLAFVLLLAMMTLVVVGKDLLLPEPGVKASTGIQAPQFIRIKTLDDLKTRLEAARGKPVLLEVDGGVKADNIGEIAAAGADAFVAGSAVYGAGKDSDPQRYNSIIGALRAELGKV